MKNLLISLIAVLAFGLSASAASIETDRKWYVAGEQMNVNIKLDNALIAYAELCDTNGLAASTIIGLSEGEGTGIVELPANLHSGYYVLSVYTRDNAKVYNKLVAIVNTLSKSHDDDIEWLKAESCEVMAKGTAELVNEKDVDLCEDEGHIVKARVKNAYEDNLFKGSQIVASLSIIGKQIHYFEGNMVDDSTAVFNTFGVYGKQPLVLSARSSTGVSLPIEMISPFATLLPKKLPHLMFRYNRSEVEARSIEMQRHQMAIAPVKRELQLGVFADETTEETIPLDYDDTLFGGKPFLAYNLDEYRQFLTIKEVLIEYVGCVSKKKTNGITHLYVIVDSDNYHSQFPSLVLIDGMPVFDIERLLSYDARRIHHVNIYGGQYAFGNGVYNGVLSFVTRSGQLTNYPTEHNMQYVVYDFPECTSVPAY